MDVQYITIIDALLAHAQQKPKDVAFKFCSSDQNISITWSGLAIRAKTLATIIANQAHPGDRVLLVYAPGIEFISAFLACCLAGVIAIPCFPPNNESLSKKLTAIIADALPTLTLHDAQTQAIEKIPSLITSNLTTDTNIQFKPFASENNIVFLQYSSGSTGDPKGVIINHQNIVANVRHIINTCGLNKKTRILCWMPHTHDMGLVGHLLLNIYLGSYLCLVPPSLMVRHPFSILMLLKEESLNTFGIPNFACELCIKRIKPEQLVQLDLSHVQTVTVGAEPINAKVLQEFSEKFACVGFKSTMFVLAYGLAENTLIASAHRGLDIYLTDEKEIVNCGSAIETLKIVHPESLIECADGETGEIWLSGASVATGYWNKLELTAQLLQAKLLQDTRHYLRTGDIACMKNGNLFVHGRIKEMMIFSGEKYFPQDIEMIILNATEQLEVQDCVAFSADIKGAEHLITIIKIQRSIDSETYKTLSSKIRKAVLQHHQLAIKDIICVANTIPRTTSGKKQRIYCQKLYETRQLEKYFKVKTTQEEVYATTVN